MDDFAGIGGVFVRFLILCGIAIRKLAFFFLALIICVIVRSRLRLCQKEPEVYIVRIKTLFSID